jgi:transcriptional regulator with XRE-family HTH domain
MQSPMTLGQKIRYARRSVGLSQRQLGEMLRVSDKAVSSYEVDRAVPPLDTLKEISRATTRPISYFIVESQPNEPSLEQKMAAIEHELREIKRILKRQFGE